MTKAFAKVTNQDFRVYYAEDTVKGRGGRVLLTGQNAHDAWNTDIKRNANDLSGKLALAIGMPVIIVDNVAVELKVSNGSRGTLAGINFFRRGGRRIAISVDVDLPNYANPDPTSINPHRITLAAKTSTITYKTADNEK
ncbi:hypothetical protein GYMLUDRAFT_141527, partial [Collybiopsis luxurians FD-317 M1]